MAADKQSLNLEQKQNPALELERALERAKAEIFTKRSRLQRASLKRKMSQWERWSLAERIVWKLLLMAARLDDLYLTTQLLTHYPDPEEMKSIIAEWIAWLEAHEWRDGKVRSLLRGSLRPYTRRRKRSQSRR